MLEMMGFLGWQSGCFYQMKLDLKLRSCRLRQTIDAQLTVRRSALRNRNKGMT